VLLGRDQFGQRGRAVREELAADLLDGHFVDVGGIRLGGLDVRCHGRGFALKATEQPIDTSTAAGKAFLDMLGVFAEFETNIRRERQMEGIAMAMADGVYTGKGRPASVDATQVRALKAQGSHSHREGTWHRSGQRLSRTGSGGVGIAVLDRFTRCSIECGELTPSNVAGT